MVKVSNNVGVHADSVGAAMVGAGGATALQTANELVQLGAGIVAIAGGIILIYRFFRPYRDDRIDGIIERLDKGAAKMQALDERIDEHERHDSGNAD